MRPGLALACAAILAGSSLLLGCSKTNNLEPTCTELSCKACTPGSFDCDGRRLLQCDAEGLGYAEEVALCDTASLCQGGISEGLCATGAACDFDGDCTGTTTDCQKPACLKGRCGTGYVANDAPIGTQTQGDCLVSVCDGAGNPQSRADPADTPTSDSPCVTYACGSAGSVRTNASSQTVCGNSGHCDGLGSCVECTPGQIDGCATTTSQRQCNAVGAWEDKGCPALQSRCDAATGVCYGGNPLAWVPSGQGANFAIDVQEVTRDQYNTWIVSSPSTQGQVAACTWNTSFTPECEWPPGSNGDLPVVCVDWCDARAYCQAMGKRLCGGITKEYAAFDGYDVATDSQWFRACSAAASRNFPYGGNPSTDQFDGYSETACNGSDYAKGAPAAAGSIASCKSSGSQYGGIFDLSGNVDEWEGACAAMDGPSDSCRVRGGSFMNSRSALACGSPGSQDRQARLDTVGFRCCAQ